MGLFFLDDELILRFNIIFTAYIKKKHVTILRSEQ
jgi:hypothetical protein